MKKKCECGCGSYVKGSNRFIVGHNLRGIVPWNKGTKGIMKPNSGSFKKGSIPWMKGRHYQTNDSLIKYIKENGPWNKGKKCPKSSGKNHSNWQGGLTSVNERIRKSIEYGEWRTGVFIRDNFECVQGGSNEEIEGHHIKAKSIIVNEFLIKNKYETADEKFNAIMENCKELWDISNGITLCRKCHKQTDTYGFTKKLRILKYEVASAKNI